MLRTRQQNLATAQSEGFVTSQAFFQGKPLERLQRANKVRGTHPATIAPIRLTQKLFVKDALARLSRFLGSQATNGETSSYSHWHVYFDDAACINVIAKDFEIV